ncbi:MAG: molybdopterin-dependent oxidoreductase, partial [bacterium]|nr:molybdopterin-dependent oxidoreductase [bacterium]
MKKVASFEEGAKEDLWVNSACYMCYSPCGIKVHKVNGIVAKIEGNPDFPHNMGKLCAKGNAGIIGLYDPYRIKKPMKRTNPDKGIGVDPKWVEISWEEAMDTIVERLKKIREDDPRKLVVLSFDVASMQYAAIWAGAFGTPNAVWTSHYFCGSARHLLTYLTNSSFHCHVDLEYCNYLILIGGGHGFMTGLNPVLSAKKMADARMRGMKLVVVDPVCSIAGAKANEWIPIRPGTDGALALAMLNVLLNELKIYDADFIKIKTNGPYLVGEDGYYIREKDTKKPLIWDSYDNRPKPYDAEIKEAAIEGTYRIGGTKCNPAFALLKDHVRQYTPEEVSTITTVPSETIRRIAKEFGEAARIGSKIVIDGVELPFRPAAVHPYRGAYGHKNGGHTAMAIQLLNLIMGAIHVPGSHQGANPIGPFSAWEPKEGPDGLV